MYTTIDLFAGIGGIRLGFEDFAKNVIQLSSEHPALSLPARIHRVGVTNAAALNNISQSNFSENGDITH